MVPSLSAVYIFTVLCIHLRGRDPTVPLRPDPVNTRLHAGRLYARVMCVTMTASPLRTDTVPSYLARNFQHYMREGGCVRTSTALEGSLYQHLL